MQFKHIFLLLSIFTSLVVLLSGGSVEAAQEKKPMDPRTSFVRYGELEPLNLAASSVVEVEVGNSNKNQFAVYEIETNNFQPFIITTSSAPVTFEVYSDNKQPEENKLNDNNQLTFVEYPLQNSNNSVVFTLDYEKPITSTSIEFSLDMFVSLPDTIKLEVQVKDPTFGDYSGSTVLAQQKVNNTQISFPKTTAQRWYVTFNYSQPLRISEIAINPTKPEWQIFNLRFLAKPSQNYRIYMLTDQEVYIPTAEMGNLEDSSITALPVKFNFTTENPLYQRADQDNDKVFDEKDSCPSVPNSSQEDINKNGKGDASEDFDLDGIINAKDNCPDHPNYVQQDEDRDGIGDHCDGVESRWIEQLPFVPWLGIGVGFLIVLVMFKTTLKSRNIDKQDEPVIPSDIA